LLVSALVGAAVIVAVPVGGARAAALPAPSRLPITGLTQIVADGVHNHLFLSGGGSVVVTGLAGNLVRKLDVNDGAGYMALSGDGRTLYVVLRDKRAVAVISTVTLRQTALYSLGADRAPAGIADQGGKLWVSYAAPGGKPGIGYFTLAAGGAFTPAALAGPTWTTAPRLAGDPLDEGVLVAIDNTRTPRKIATYDVLGATPVLLAESSAFGSCTALSDLAVAPAGAQVILACGGEGNDTRYATKTLAPAGSYQAGRGSDAVAVALDGSVAAGTAKGSAQLSVYQRDRRVAMNRYRFAGAAVAADGLAWTSDSTRLFAVLERTAARTDAARYYLQELVYPQFKATSIDIAAAGTGTIVIDRKVRLSGKVAFGGKPAPAGIMVTVIRGLTGSAAVTDFTVRTRAGGVFRLTDTPPVWGSYNYTAYFASDGVHEPAWHTTFVTVTGLRTTLTVTAPATATAGKRVWVVAHLGRTYRNRTVSIYEQPASGGRRRLIKTGRVGVKGNFGVNYRVTRSTTFIAVFSGDAHYTSLTAKATVPVQS
jgi:hypothetical protein